GMLWLPADFKPGTRLPLVLSVHGGPAGAWDVSFRAINHVYTGLGWAVLEPNVRGSSSYGDALLRGNMKDIGGGDYFDLMTGVDRLIADGIADPDHLAIRSWSDGRTLGGRARTPTSWPSAAGAPAASSAAGRSPRRRASRRRRSEPWSPTGRQSTRWASTTTCGSGISAARRGRAPSGTASSRRTRTSRRSRR